MSTTNTYCVYSYQYNNMPKSKVSAVSVGKRTKEQVLDTLPATVIDVRWIPARTKEEAKRTFCTLRKTQDQVLSGWTGCDEGGLK